jgi:hypothetical protein
MADNESQEPERDDRSAEVAQSPEEVEGSAERDAETPPRGEAEGEEVAGVVEGTGETEEQYEPLPGGGHRVTRRTVHRTRVVEDVEETVTEYLPPSAYVAPAAHPAPVG